MPPAPIIAPLLAVRRRWLGLSGNLRGAAWLLASALMFSVMNGLAKLLGDQLHPFQVAFFRCLFGFLPLAPFLLRAGAQQIWPRRPGLQVVRSVAGILTMLTLFWSLAHLPLALAVAIFFTKPLFMVGLAVAFLGERVRWRRWLATGIGFVGVLVMLRPGGGIGVAALAALAGAFGMGVVLVLVKKLTASETPTAMVFWFLAAGAVGTLPPALAVWQWPSGTQWLLLAALGGIGGGAQILATRAYRVGEATVITPVDYFQLLFSAVIGIAVFGEVPDGWTMAGAAIVVASTLYIVEREARLAKS